VVGERYGLHSLECVDQPRVILCAPAEIFYPGYVACLVVELAHSGWGEAFERRTVTTTIREHVDEVEK
jgi:hypothetical protein